MSTSLVVINRAIVEFKYRFAVWIFIRYGMYINEAIALLQKGHRVQFAIALY